jgi:hypothetical protein
VGGKSVYWGGWCPRLTNDTLAAWPRAVAQYLKDNYHLLEEQLGVSGRTDFIQGSLYAAMLAKAKAVLPRVRRLAAVEPPPLAVLGRAPADNEVFPFMVILLRPKSLSAKTGEPQKFSGTTQNKARAFG